MACDGNRYNTGNEICSSDLRDLKDDVIIIDGYVNSEEDTVKDRFGIDRLTLTGIQDKSDKQHSNIQDRADNQNTAINDRADSAISKFEGEIDAIIKDAGGVEVLNTWSDSIDSPLSSGFIKKNLGYVTPEMFSAVGNGDVDDTQSILDMFEYANSNKLNVVANKGVFKLVGSTNIPVSVSCNLNGSVFDVNDWSGSFVVNNGRVIQDTSAIKQALIDSMPVNKSNRVFKGFLGNAELDNIYVMYDTDIPLYTYRGEVMNFKDMFIHYSRGSISSGVNIDIPEGTDVTNIKAIKIPSTFLKFEGASFKDSAYKGNFIIKVKESCKVILQDLGFEGSTSVKAGSNRFIIEESALTIVRNMYCSSSLENVDDPDTFVYSFSLSHSHLISIEKLHADGLGWGSTGSNFCKDISFKECKLNRIDFHNYCSGVLNVRNCDLGWLGIQVTMLGDLIVSDTTFNHTYGGIASNVVSLRPDAGGWSYGALKMNNIRIVLDADASDPVLLVVGSNTESPVEDSPVGFNGFTDVHVDGVYLESSRGVTLKLLSGHGFSKVGAPKEINLSNVYGNVDTISYDTGFHPSNYHLNLSECPSSNLSLTGPGNVINISRVGSPWVYPIISLDISSEAVISDSFINILKISKIGESYFRANVRNSDLRSVETKGIAPSLDDTVLLLFNSTYGGSVAKTDVVRASNSSLLSNIDIVLQEFTPSNSVTFDVAVTQTKYFDLELLVGYTPTARFVKIPYVAIGQSVKIPDLAGGVLTISSSAGSTVRHLKYNISGSDVIRNLRATSR